MLYSMSTCVADRVYYAMDMCILWLFNNLITGFFLLLSSPGASSFEALLEGQELFPEPSLEDSFGVDLARRRGEL
jgi:hypothetical protein